MAVPQRPFFPQPPARTRGGGSVLAVGRRVLVSCPGGATGRATLTDAKGTTPLATLPHGAEVEILGWQPRGASGTRYSIRSSESGVEGWVGGDSLRAPAPPPPSDTIVSAASLVEGARPPKASAATTAPRRSGERAPTKAARRPR
jgi:hypothetical protein